MKTLKLVLLYCVLFFISACEKEKKTEVTRWYTKWQLELGAKVYKSNCVKCHGDKGQGTLGKYADKATNFYPAPNLDASSDSLQQPISVLIDKVNYGGSKTDGKMPMFGDKLSASEILTVIAYFQTFWSDDDYEQWLEWGGLN